MARGKPKEGPVDTVTFEDPPPKNLRYDWTAIADQLREHPGKWALVFARDRTSIANAVRYGQIAALHPDLGFEARTANNVREPVRMCSLYLRYVPERVDPLRATINDSRKGT